MRCGNKSDMVMNQMEQKIMKSRQKNYAFFATLKFLCYKFILQNIAVQHTNIKETFIKELTGVRVNNKNL